MADKKISELTSIVGADTAADDFFVVVDTSGSATKKISRAELNNAIEQDVLAQVDITSANIDGGTIDNTPIGATTASTGNFTTVDTTGNVTVGGNLTVNGTTTTVNSTTLDVDDINITVASGAANAAAADGAGLTVDGASATFNYASTGDKWTMNKPLDVAGTITADGLTVDGGTTDTVTDFRSTDTSALIRFTDSGGSTYAGTTYQNGNGAFIVYTGGDTSGAGSHKSVTIDGGGDVSLYDSSGVSQGFYWDASTQRLGLGTTSPSGLLHIYKNDSSDCILKLGNTDGEALIVANGGNLYTNTPTHTIFQTNSSESMRIDSSGNVGIGTSGPSAKLDVYDTSAGLTSTKDLTGRFYRNDGTYNPRLEIRHSTAGTTLRHTYSSGAANLMFEIGTTERMRIDGSGNVGIGTSSPAWNLHTYQSGPLNSVFESDTGNSNLRITSGDGDSAQIFFGDQTNDTISIIKHDNSDNSLAFYTAGSNERMRIDSSGNVGIGTSSPINNSTTNLQIHGGVASGSSELRLTNADTGATASDGFQLQMYQGTDAYLNNRENGPMIFKTNNSEAMRIDSSGNLLINHTATGDWTSTSGAQIRATGLGIFTQSASSAVIANRLSTDGTILELRKGGTAVGVLGTISGDMYLGTDAAGVRFINDNVIPVDAGNSGTTRDDAIDLGASYGRFDDIYATNGTIQTSDVNEKQDIEALSDAEQRVAVAAKGLLRKYRWKSSVEEKGDDARIHFGIIAQDLQAAFEAEGLDAGRYAMFINSEWTDEETGEQKSRMGIRYNQLLAFIIAAI